MGALTHLLTQIDGAISQPPSQVEPSALPGGSAARLAGDQLCHWNTLAPDSVLKATHLVVFLPPCLGAFVLSNHSSHSPAFFKYPPPELQTNEGLTACVKQVANYPLPSILVNQEEKLSSARKSADGYLSSYTIPLLAEPETLAQHAKLNWVLRFPLPPPNQMSTRRFSSTPSYNHGPRTPQALDGALRFASSFTYDTPPVLTPSTSSFLQLPDPVTKFGEVRRPAAGPLPAPPQDIQDWLTRVRSAFIPKRNISFQVPLFKPCLPLLKNTSLVKSAWIS